MSRVVRTVPDETRAAQARAADPARTVWVSANAGSGKTWVLSERVIRLLLNEADPARILCLTYTRAAAAEMSNRVFKRLADWTRLDDTALDAEIGRMEGRPPDAAKRATARRLFARALETPGGLNIRTIHAFCESLLHRFPLEANVPGHFEMLDNLSATALTAEAANAMVAAIGAPDTGGEDHAAFAAVIAEAGAFGLEMLIAEIVRQRSKLRRLLDALPNHEERRQAYLSTFCFDTETTEAEIMAEPWPLDSLPVEMLREMYRAAEKSGNTKPYEFAYGLGMVSKETDPAERFAMLGNIFLTKAGAPRKLGTLATKAIVAAIPDIAGRIEDAAMQFANVRDRLALFRQIGATLSALQIADRLIRGYEALKRARGFLDFDDLIERAAALFERDAGRWVQYKLDQGIDHILVDEAQDTAPRQWQVIERLAEEFFAGAGARNLRRTLFAVGDEKQSIYSFQGADPAGFAAAGERARAKAGKEWDRVPLTLSFRSTADVLAAVETVFADPDARRGLSFGEDGFPVHQSNRMGEPGHVELWPLERATPAEEPEDWKEPIDAERAPEVLVAERIASTIHGWLKDGERLEGTGEAIRPGDILVLVRKRDRFMHALSRALKNRHVPVAGADRLRLTDHIAVQDLMAIGRFVLQPADDLSLAALLKSPLFDFSDDDLFVLAHGRGAATLFQSMREKARGEVRFASAVETLSRWRARADRVSVFEFYDSILGPEAGRARLIARLGTETADMLDEFLAFALAQERVGLPGLENFLATLDTARPEIKREMDARRGEVRIMTVHASKGLEAPVVVLVDPGSKAFSHAHLPDLMEIEHAPPDWTSPLFLWRIGEHAKNAVMAQNGARLKARAEEEYRRLLYVAMTRAADRLIVAGYATPRGGGEGTWHAMIEAALGPHCREIARDGFTAKRFELDRTRPAESAGEDARKEAAPDTAPGWLGEPAAPEPPPPRPLQPSGASLVIGEFRARSESPSWSSPLLTAQTQSGEPVGREGAARTALQRGAAIHRLLQVLPDCPQADRDNRALAWLAALEPDWSDAERRAILASVLRVLDDPRFAPLFAEGSAAEVAVMGTVEIAGRPRAVSGVIDRLAVTPGSVLVADYKTDRTPASSPADVPPTYRAQLALYRALLRSLYPDRAIETVIVYTETATLVPVPAQALDEALAALAGT